MWGDLDIAAQRPRDAPRVDVADPIRLEELAKRYFGDKEKLRLVHGNRVTLLRDGVDAFPEMLSAIRSAKKRVRLETYIFMDDALGDLFARELIAAADRGVRVTVLYDALGSWRAKSAFFKNMRKNGVDVHAFRPFSFSEGIKRLVQRDHRKLLVVDGEIAFVGGINIAAEWAPIGRGGGGGWRDDALRVEGPAAAQLEMRFCASWRVAVRERLRVWRHRTMSLPPPPKGDLPVAILSSRRSIHRAYLTAIQAAMTSVLIAAGYFIPDRKLLNALTAASKRGVEVALILAGKSDHPFLTWASRGFYGKLLEAGVHIYEWCDVVLHAKTAVVDGAWATVGSFNLERMSMFYNHEVNVAFVDPRYAKNIEDSFRNDSHLCCRITLEDWKKRPLWRRALERLAYAFRRIL